MNALVAVAILILVSGCSTRSSDLRPESYYQDVPSSDDSADLIEFLEKSS